MATEITIPSIDWGNPPLAVQSMTFQIKLWSDPESAYADFATGVQVDTDGTVLDSPLPSASGLTDGELYYVRAYNECSSPFDYFIMSVQL